MLDVKVLRSQPPDFIDDATLASPYGRASQPPATIMSKSDVGETSTYGVVLCPSVSAGRWTGCIPSRSDWPCSHLTEAASQTAS